MKEELPADVQAARAATALQLGFSGLEEMEAWEAAGSPTFRCSNERCLWTGLWSRTTCLHCGYPLVETGRLFTPKDVESGGG